MPFHWTAQFHTSPQSPIALSGALNFAVTPVGSISHRTKPIVIDGRLDDWSKLAHPVLHPAVVWGADTWTGPADLKYEFDLAYDDDNLYIAVNVTDDHVAAIPTLKPWQQDGIELMLDARDDPERANNRRDYSQGWQSYCYLAFSPGNNREQMAVWEAEKIPPGVTFACVPTASGYSAEVLVPNRVLNALGRTSQYDTIRFSISVHDAEEPGGPSTTQWWLPDWHSPQNIPGAGTFRKKH